ncbi:hypothetical protein [Tenggerimyces flavus]|uniref:Uncharacterized protein n=1 Tax=Tenggerimyces flavus TaxID=1708749 RepID=A0ABV7YHX2_9ACTN|nr:hypothetical protein [Tenggerimyces flavus]MBM7784719.1 hypothetical protein [Tenggerimyces flavus]
MDPVWLLWWFLVPTAALLYGFGPVSRQRVASFASAHGVVVTAENGPILVDYLARVARWRTVGGAAGWLVGGWFALPGEFVGWGLGGYLAGAVAVELAITFRTQVPNGPRRATLSVRRSGDYVTWGASWGPLLVLAVLALQGIGYLLWPSADLQPEQLIPHLVAMIGVVTILWISRRAIVQRPQPVVAEALRAADDAIRASSLQSISGASLALLCLVSADVMWRIKLSSDLPQPLSWTFAVLSFAVLAAVPVAWFVIRVRSRRLRRTVTHAG